MSDRFAADGTNFAVFPKEPFSEETLRHDIKLTIQDYFNRRNVHKPVLRLRPGIQRSAGIDDSAFSRTLDMAQASASAKRRGLTIRDYMAKPRPVLQPVIAPEAAIADQQRSGHAHPNDKVVPRNVSVATTLPSSQATAAANTHGKSGFDKERAHISASIEQAAGRYDLPSALLHAVVRAESDYQVHAQSPAGAQGLMQLMPATAIELGVQNPFDIDQNIDGGAKYLRSLLDRFKGDMELALSAYNAGPGTVARYNGKVPFEETRRYVDRVMRFTRHLS